MIRALTIAAALLLAAPCFAQTPEDRVADTDWAPQQEVMITKDMPGPAMWRVVKDDKVVWIIGTTYMKSKARWDTQRIDKLLTGAGTLYLPPMAIGNLSSKRYLQDKDLPGTTTLKDVLPAGEYQRFRDTAKRHRLRTSDIERDKPFWAGTRLVQAFNKKHGYSSSAVVQQLNTRAKTRKVRVARVATYDVEPYLEHLGKLDDKGHRECLTARLNTLDYNAAVGEKVTAAWVKGDVEALKPILRGAPKSDCLGELGQEFMTRSTADTISVIEKAMTGDRRSVLILPLYVLITDDRLVTDLRQQGFQVREPR